jgi:protein RecA
MSIKKATKKTVDMDDGDLDSLISETIGANDKRQEVKVWLDTGYPPLNKAISGDYTKGLPCGRIVEIFGPSSCGKTAIATKALISAQQADGLAILMDHEHSFDLTHAIDLGLDPSKRWVYKHPETFEQSIDWAVKLARAVREKKAINPDAPIVVVFDSLASMVPHSKMYDKNGQVKSSEDYSMHDNMALAKATSSAFPALAQMANKYNMLLLFINQVRVKPGVSYGDPNTTPGGAAPEYYSTVRVALTREMIRDKATKELLGQTINAVVRKNRVHAPFKKASWNFMFRPDGTGYFDVIGSMVELLAENGVLKRDGNGYIWTDGKKYMKPALAKKIEEEGGYNDLLAMLTGAGIEDKDEDSTTTADFEG